MTPIVAQDLSIPHHRDGHPWRRGEWTKPTVQASIKRIENTGGDAIGTLWCAFGIDSMAMEVARDAWEEEDGLSLNLVGLEAKEGGPRKATPAVKGGWKERRKAIAAKRAAGKRRKSKDESGRKTKEAPAKGDGKENRSRTVEKDERNRPPPTPTDHSGPPKPNEEPRSKEIVHESKRWSTEKDAVKASGLHAKKAKVIEAPTAIERRRPEVQLPRATAKGKTYLVPEDAKSFPKLGVQLELANHLKSLGFQTPTETQKRMLPPLLNGEDVMANAPTGSGKTLAFLLPAVQALTSREKRVHRNEGTFAMVICPTRELCLQIWEVLSLLLKNYYWIVSGMVMGGENRSKEKARLRKGINIVVGTPGRLKDHLENTSAWKVENLQFLVLDEADRLLDLGFEETLTGILDTLAKKVKSGARWQSCLCSATLHAGVRSLAEHSLKEPCLVGFSAQEPNLAQDPLAGAMEELRYNGRQANTGSADDFHIPETLEQFYVQVPCKLRFCALLALLHRYARSKYKVVVFFNSCDGVEFASRVLRELASGPAHENKEAVLECPVITLHGNLTQPERTSAFFKFTGCKSGVLLSTDVAARGLDFPTLDASVQFDPPGEPAEYVHRVGRTARMGRKGKSVLFLLPSEQPYLVKLQEYGLQISKLDVLKLLDALPGFRPSTGIAYADQHPAANALLKRMEISVAMDRDASRLSKDAFGSYVRAYCTYPKALKDIFHVKNLHLGHVAASFGLKEPPAKIGKSTSKQAMQKRKLEAVKKMQRKKKKSAK
eukprot:scaffold283_cov316-Pavlova_lutheri.AAC.8